MSSPRVNRANVKSLAQADPKKIFAVLNGEWLRRSKSTNTPFSIEAQPTNICNFACKFCSYASRRMSSGYTSWDLDTGLRFAQFLRSEPVRVLCLSGGGEPLAWPHMEEFLEKLSGVRHLKKVLITNGSLIGSKIPLSMFRDFSLLLISIVSTVPMTYRQSMCGAAAKSATLENVLSLPERFGSSGPDLNACVVVSKANSQNLAEIAVELISRGFSFVYFKAEYDYESTEVEPATRARNKIPEMVFRLPQSVIERTNLLTFLQDCREKEAQEAIQRARCLNLEHKLNVIVDAAGDIYPCIPRVGDSIYSFGNIRTSQSTQPLKSLFDADLTFRKICSEYQSGQCGRCRFKKYNELVAEAEQGGKSSSVEEPTKHLDFI